MNLQSTINLDVKGFFNWWFKELKFLVPEKVKTLISDRTGLLVITEQEEYFDLHFIPNSFNHPELKLKITDNLNFSTLKTQYPCLEHADCILRLDNQQALLKYIYLPVAAQDNLQQVIGFELDRYTPFNAEQVYFSAVGLSKTEYGQLEVLLIITPKFLLDNVLLKANSFQLFPVIVDCAGAKSTDFSFNLLPKRFKQAENRLDQLLQWTLNSVLVGLFLAVLILPVVNEQQVVDLLSQQVKTLEKDNALVDRQQREIEAVKEQTQALINIKNDAPALVAVMNELTNLLNNDTSLTSFQYSDKKLQIQGLSPAASNLISLLETSEYFSNVNFVSPLTQDKSTGKERFQISMDVSNVMPVIPEPVTVEEPVVDSNPIVDSEPAAINDGVPDASSVVEPESPAAVSP